MEHEMPARLEKRARRAYEIGRAERGIVRTWPVPIAAFLATRLGAPEIQTAALAIALFVVCAGFSWKGGPLGRGVFPGLFAGIAPLILPGLAMDCATACSASCALWCSVSCVAGGMVAGAFVGVSAARFGQGRLRFLAAASGIAAMTGGMGCLLGGMIGVAGMILGFALGAAPALVLATRRA
jgi:hypothetical protein